MARNYRLPTIKELFANASKCAYPSCDEPLVFEDPARGVRVIAVQVAHIRSEKPNGPRYDPSFDKTLINESGNLLLLCGKHHPAVDQNESVFTTAELLEWKANQVGSATGITVTDADIGLMMQSLQTSLAILTELLELRVELGVVGGKVIDHDVISMRIGAVKDVLIPEAGSPTVLVGAQVVNKSTAGVDVAAGFEFDFGDMGIHTWLVEGPWCPPDRPHRLEGRSTQIWFVEATVVHATILMLGRRFGRIPLHFRAFAQLGDGTSEVDDWHHVAELPIWKEGITQAQIEAIGVGPEAKAGASGATPGTGSGPSVAPA